MVDEKTKPWCKNFLYIEISTEDSISLVKTQAELKEYLYQN